MDILRTHYYFETLPYAYYCPRPVLPEDPKDLNIDIECKTKFPITNIEEMENIREYKMELRRFYMVKIKLPDLYIQIGSRKQTLPVNYENIDTEFRKYLPWNPELDNEIYYDTLINQMKEKYYFKNLPSDYFYRKI